MSNLAHKVINHRLFKGSVIYFFAILINYLISFFTVPVLTRYLSPSDYGIVSIVQVFLSILVIFVCMGVDNSITVNYFRLSKDKFGAYIKNVLYLILFNYFVVFVAAFFMRDYLADFLKISDKWVLISVASIIGAPFVSIAIMLLIAGEKVLQRSIFIVIQTLSNLTLSLLFVILFQMKWDGRLLGLFVTTALFAIVGIIIIRGHIKGTPGRADRNQIKSAMKFGLPLVPYMISGQIMMGIDRFFLGSMVGVAATGIYAVGYQMGIIISSVASAFNTIWLPFFYRKLADGTHESRIIIVKLTYIIFIGLILIALIWGISSPYVLKYLLGKDFQGSAQYVIWIAMAYAFEGIYNIISGYIYYTRKTWYLTIVGIIAAATNIVLTYTLIKLNGVLGAAQATFITYLLFAGMGCFVSNKAHKMPWALRSS